MEFPIYRENSIYKNDDFNSIISLDSIDKLCVKLYHSDLSVINTENSIRTIIESAEYNAMATGGLDEASKKAFTVLIKNIYDVAKSFGFPNKIQTITTFDFDKKLAICIYETLENVGRGITPSIISNLGIQRFMTQRFFPLVVHWRWYEKDKNKISGDRINHGSRNYFFTLMMIAWLSDKGRGAENRWELMDALNADITVAIIERPGTGFRRGFFRSLANKIILYKKNNSDANMSEIVRGIMKRATLTFSVTAMIDDEQFYIDIVDYLFNWSVNNYKRNKTKNFKSDENELNNLAEVEEFEDDSEYNDKVTSIKNDEAKYTYDDDLILSEISNAVEVVCPTKIYIKKLTSNELGYRNGEKGKSTPSFYISKDVSDFFPQMKKVINNYTVDLIFEFGMSETKLNYTYHNDKFNRPGGTRDELRIYLNKAVTRNNPEHFKPSDIIAIIRKSENRYVIKRYRKGELKYQILDEFIERSPIKGGHAMVSYTDVGFHI